MEFRDKLGEKMMRERTPGMWEGAWAEQTISSSGLIGLPLKEPRTVLKCLNSVNS